MAALKPFKRGLRVGRFWYLTTSRRRKKRNFMHTIESLRIGQMVRVVHPYYAKEYPKPVKIVCLYLFNHVENITIEDGGQKYDGWKTSDLEVVE